MSHIYVFRRILLTKITLIIILNIKLLWKLYNVWTVEWCGGGESRRLQLTCDTLILTTAGD